MATTGRRARVAVARALASLPPAHSQHGQALIVLRSSLHDLAFRHILLCLPLLGETSPVWQDSADAKPDELRQNLDRANELRLLAEQADALNTLVQFNTDYHHFVAADKARVAYNVGNRLGGNEGKAITPHLKIARESLPKRHKAVATAKFIADPDAPPAKQ